MATEQEIIDKAQAHFETLTCSVGALRGSSFGVPTPSVVTAQLRDTRAELIALCASSLVVFSPYGPCLAHQCSRARELLDDLIVVFSEESDEIPPRDLGDWEMHVQDFEELCDVMLHQTLPGIKECLCVIGDEAGRTRADPLYRPSVRVNEIRLSIDELLSTLYQISDSSGASPPVETEDSLGDLAAAAASATWAVVQLESILGDQVLQEFLVRQICEAGIIELLYAAERRLANMLGEADEWLCYPSETFMVWLKHACDSFLKEYESGLDAACLKFYAIGVLKRDAFAGGRCSRGGIASVVDVLEDWESHVPHTALARTILEVMYLCECGRANPAPMGRVMEALSKHGCQASEKSVKVAIRELRGTLPPLVDALGRRPRFQYVLTRLGEEVGQNIAASHKL